MEEQQRQHPLDADTASKHAARDLEFWMSRWCGVVCAKTSTGRLPKSL